VKLVLICNVLKACWLRQVGLHVLTTYFCKRRI
jgi:hypothetical protein